MPSNLRISQSPFVSVHAFLNNTQKRHRGLDFALTLTTGLASIIIFLLAYLLVWGVSYRFPPTPALLVDKRIDKAERPHYVAICAALAANDHGFPGHAYVAWSDSLPIDLTRTDSRGFVPLHAADQVPSLWQQVPGIVVERAADGNQRNLNAVVAIVDRKTFEFSKEKSRSWQSDKFKVGSSDCVAFANSLATTIGLKTPDARYKYPQDYVDQLKNLNLNQVTVLPNKHQTIFAISE